MNPNTTRALIALGTASSQVATWLAQYTAVLEQNANALTPDALHALRNDLLAEQAKLLPPGAKIDTLPLKSLVRYAQLRDAWTALSVDQIEALQTQQAANWQALARLATTLLALVA